LVDGQIGGLGAVEDLSEVNASLVPGGRAACSIAYTSIRHALGQLDGRKAVEQDGNGGWRIASEANS
jgi:hypothetical protein